MSSVIKVFKTIRNNWKKSTFFSLCLVYGYKRTKEYNETQQLMREYSIRASKFGNETISKNSDPRTITIILNPSANRRKCMDDFENYCAPLLHLAGLAVDIVKTESEGHAKTLVNDLKSTDALVVAGGDGTVSETITGLLRRTNENTNGLVAIGVLPLGRTNSLAHDLFGNEHNSKKVQMLADATMAIVENVTKPINIMKIEPLDEKENKPIYAATGIKWGAFRDAQVKKDAYWYWGSLRNYVTYVFNGYKNDLTWICQATVSYTQPCAGCSNCTKTPEEKKGLFGRFHKPESLSSRYVLNPDCSVKYDKKISTSEFILSIGNDQALPKLKIITGPQYLSYFEFIKEGWDRENKQEKVNEEIDARVVEIIPNSEKDATSWFSIDNENFELKPVKVTILPKLINVFCKKNSL